MLPSLDRRSTWARRFKDLLLIYEADLGGDADNRLSEGQRALARRAALLQLELEYQDVRFGQLAADGKAPSRERLDSYARIASQLRRLVESLGLNVGRQTKDVTPPHNHDYTEAIIEGIKAGRFGTNGATGR
ncbi:hypothetical protein [Mesorhizobium sp. CN2-181]|uniref:hypothetical protein n=1 Tax=Mesorhizobium yinganensis TaxID=3157707 RepID=UPI0032B742F3